MIFGTDGIRGRFGEAPLDQDTIERLSEVITFWLEGNAKIIIGCDTRASCGELRSWILAKLGRHIVIDLGVVPTPVVAYETQARAAALGIMITASHNPAHDNGLKFFGDNGLKLSSGVAASWSSMIEEPPSLFPPGPALPVPSQPTLYIEFIKRHFSKQDFEGLRVGFDLAQGAGSLLVPQLCEALGLESLFLGCEPDGENINKDCGALHPAQLEALVADRQLDLGFALDGDGDRLIVVAPKALSGDLVLYALARNLQREGVSFKSVVGTIMCGMGLEKAFADLGLGLVRTAVGDQHVLEEMCRNWQPLGGEPSGHIIQADLFSAGDGLLAALRLARALKRNPELIAEAKAAVVAYEVHEKGFVVAKKPPLETLAQVHPAIEALNAALGETGRLIIRYSGTEPKLRLYVEAADLAPYRANISALEQAIMGDLC